LDGGVRRKVEFGQVFRVRESGLSDPPASLIDLALGQLTFQEHPQHIQEGPALAFSFPERLRQQPGKSGETELLQVGLDRGHRHVAHTPTPTRCLYTVGSGDCTRYTRRPSGIRACDGVGSSASSWKACCWIAS